MISPQYVDGLEQRIKELTHERDELSEQLKTSRRDYEVMNKFREGAEAEREAMAAHIERCRDVFSGLSEYWNGCEGRAAKNAAQNAMDVACDMLEELPDTSLVRLKAEWQTEALLDPTRTLARKWNDARLQEEAEGGEG